MYRRIKLHQAMAEFELNGRAVANLLPQNILRFAKEVVMGVQL
jgi:hypothetical protein